MLSFFHILFIISVLIQSIFWLCVRSFSYTNKNKIPATDGVSIIIAARNEYENLKKLLPLLLSQQYPLFEIIIANDRSTDQSLELLKNYASKYTHFSFIEITELHKEIAPKKFALHAAIQKARFNKLLFTDADCIPVSAFWVQEISNSYQKEQDQIVIGIGRYLTENTFLNSVIQFETLWTALHYITFTLLGKPYMAVGRNLSYKKEIFMNTDGFGEHQKIISGDDDLLINRLAHSKNTTLSLNPISHTRSNPKTTWREWFLQKKRHLSVGKYYKLSDKLLLAGLSFSHLLSYLLLFYLFYYKISPLTTLILFVTRLCIVTLTIKQKGKYLEIPIKSIKIILFDFLFPFYQIGVGMIAQLTKKIVWK